MALGPGGQGAGPQMIPGGGQGEGIGDFDGAGQVAALQGILHSGGGQGKLRETGVQRSAGRGGRNDA